MARTYVDRLTHNHNNTSATPRAMVITIDPRVDNIWETGKTHIVAVLPARCILQNLTLSVDSTLNAELSGKLVLQNKQGKELDEQVTFGGVQQTRDDNQLDLTDSYMLNEMVLGMELNNELTDGLAHLTINYLEMETVNGHTTNVSVDFANLDCGV